MRPIRSANNWAQRSHRNDQHSACKPTSLLAQKASVEMLNIISCFYSSLSCRKALIRKYHERCQNTQFIVLVDDSEAKKGWKGHYAAEKKKHKKKKTYKLHCNYPIVRTIVNVYYNNKLLDASIHNTCQLLHMHNKRTVFDMNMY